MNSLNGSGIVGSFHHHIQMVESIAHKGQNRIPLGGSKRNGNSLGLLPG